MILSVQLLPKVTITAPLEDAMGEAISGKMKPPNAEGATDAIASNVRQSVSLHQRSLPPGGEHVLQPPLPLHLPGEKGSHQLNALRTSSYPLLRSLPQQLNLNQTQNR